MAPTATKNQGIMTAINTNNIRSSHREHSHRTRDGVVDCVDVLGKPVHDPSERSGLEETHGSAHDGGDRPAVEGSRSVLCEEADGRSGSEEGYGQGDTQASVDTHLRNTLRRDKRKKGRCTHVEPAGFVELLFLPKHKPITGHDLGTLYQQ